MIKFTWQNDPFGNNLLHWSSGDKTTRDWVVLTTDDLVDVVTDVELLPSKIHIAKFR